MHLAYYLTSEEENLVHQTDDCVQTRALAVNRKQLKLFLPRKAQLNAVLVTKYGNCGMLYKQHAMLLPAGRR